MAHEDGSPLGERFGYQVRFDRKAGPRTRVLVVTPDMSSNEHVGLTPRRSPVSISPLGK